MRLLPARREINSQGRCHFTGNGFFALQEVPARDFLQRKNNSCTI